MKKNKTVVITGAGKGIGFELVKAFLADLSFTVIAISRNTVNLKEIKNPELQIITGDLLVNYEPILAEIKKVAPYINILVNNAALVLNKEIEEITDQNIEDVMKTNFSVPFKFIRDLNHSFIKGAHIINISSMSGFQGSKKFNGLSLYSSSKAALAALSECVAEEWKEKGIYCNCLALGAVDTDMIKISIPGLRPIVTSSQMAEYIYQFSLTGHQYYNGQVIPVTTIKL